MKISEYIREENRRKVRKIVLEYYKIYGEVPSYKIITAATGIKSSRTIWEYLSEMREEGLIPKIRDNKPKSQEEKKNKNPEELNQNFLTKEEKFCLALARQGIKKITLQQLSTLFLDAYPHDRSTKITELYAAAIGAGIKVTDCAWS